MSHLFTNTNNDCHFEREEIEKILIQHPDVQEVVVIDREDQFGKKCRVAYIVSDLIPERLPYRSTCFVELEQNTMKLQTKNISSNGICLMEVPPVFEKGKHVRLCLQLPGESKERWLDGTVVWYQEQKAGIQLNLTPIEKAIVCWCIEYLIEKKGFLDVLQRIVTRRLRQYLIQSLPVDIIPKAFVILQNLPLTANNLVDYDALPNPDNISWISQHPENIS